MRSLLRLLRLFGRHAVYGSVAVCCMLLLLAPLGQANVLAPAGPGSNVAPDVAVNNGPGPGLGPGYGPIVGDTVVQNFNFAGNIGTVQEVVTTDTVTGFLDFLSEVNVTAGTIEHLTLANFANAFVLGPVDVGYDTEACLAGVSCAPVDPTTIAPTSVNTPDGGKTISFNFAPAVLGGDTSFLLVVKTQSQVFTPGTLGLIDGGGQTLNGFQPTPEPAQTGILLGGLFAAGLFLMRYFERA